LGSASLAGLHAASGATLATMRPTPAPDQLLLRIPCSFSLRGSAATCCTTFASFTSLNQQPLCNHGRNTKSSIDLSCGVGASPILPPMTDATDQQQTHKDPGLAGLVLMLPILILQMIVARFARRLDRLKQARRKRPKPRNWRDHFGRLRQCEWHIHQLVANGARKVLAFGDVDLNFIPMIVDVPEDMSWSEPSSPAALYVRMQEIARFHADPERYILRHAER